MVDCIINVRTFEGAKNFSLSYAGKAEITSLKSAKLFWTDENGDVCFTASPRPAMQRKGEYSLDFSFIKGESTPATISIGGSFGSVMLYTEEYAYKVNENEVRAYIKYSLQFGKEKQNLKVIITATL